MIFEKQVTYNIISEYYDIMDGEFSTLEDAKTALNKIIRYDRADNFECDWGKFYIQKISRKTLKSDV